MKNTVAALLVIAVFSLFGAVLAQNASLADRLTVVVNPPNAALIALFPLSVITLQTPIATRYSLFTVLPFYETRAACNSVALSFFGTKDFIPPTFCSNRDIYATLGALVTYRLLASEFPIEGQGYGTFLQKNGVDPFDMSMDKATPAGWANHIAARLINYFSNDGWNSKGDATRMDFRQSFSDPTGYKPANSPTLRSDKLRRPLRWQPLTFEADQRGNFATQVHVTPHVGIRGKPLVLSTEDFNSRKVRSPYRFPNKRNKLSVEDRKILKGYISKLLKKNRKLTTEQVALVYWWEIKFVSLGTILGFYQSRLRYSTEIATVFFLGDVMTQYEAVLLAWKEKVRHDLVRPTTMIRRFLSGKKFMAYRGFGKPLGLVKGEEWEPIVPVQPHSEFPSASATICTASLEFIQNALQSVVGANGTIPPFETTLFPGAVPFSPVNVPVAIKFSTLAALSRDCGKSRLNGGVHFEPSVAAGESLAVGVGKKVFEHVSMLFNGIVPADCTRCIRS